MAEKSIFTEKEEAFLEALSEEGVQFMLVGLSAATLQGAPVVTQDIDLWFKNLRDPGIKKALDRVGGIYVPPFEQNPPMFAGASLELFDIVVNMTGLDSFEDELRHAITLKVGEVEVRVLRLEKIIKSKKATNRQKDKLVIPVLEDSLRVTKDLK